MLDITQHRNALFVFFEEAGVQHSQNQSSRGYVCPLTEGSTKSSNIGCSNSRIWLIFPMF